MFQNICQGYRIGSVRDEVKLINVDTNTQDAISYFHTMDRALRQRTANLFVVPIDVIGPLYGYAINKSSEHIAYSKSASLEQNKLP